MWMKFEIFFMNIISSCVTLNHFWWFEVLKHNFYFVVLFIMQMFWFFMFWSWIFTLLQVCQFLVWMWCTIQSIFMLCVVNVVTMTVISVDIGTHNNFHEFNWSLVISSFVTNTHTPTLNKLIPTETKKTHPLYKTFKCLKKIRILVSHNRSDAFHTWLFQTTLNRIWLSLTKTILCYSTKFHVSPKLYRNKIPLQSSK
jgi:hypothetical protein